MAGGRRNITQNFLGSQNTILEHLRVETTCENESPTLPAELCPNPPFLTVFRQLKTFGKLVARRRAAGGPIKCFRRSHTTFIHLTIMLGWSDDSKRSLKKSSPPPKNSDFWGGVNDIFPVEIQYVLSRKPSIFIVRETLYHKDMFDHDGEYDNL